MEYYDSVCFQSAVFTSRCVGKFLTFSLARYQIFQAPRSKYSRQETHTVIIFYIYLYQMTKFWTQIESICR